MANGNGATPTDPWINESPPGAPPTPGPLVISIDNDQPDDVRYEEQDDGSLVIHIGPKQRDQAGADKHEANLAEYIDAVELARIADELLNGINADLQARQDWIDRRAAGIKHLALKIENPRSPSADADTAVEGQSTIRSPILLDAVMRFQANARGE